MGIIKKIYIILIFIPFIFSGFLVQAEGDYGRYGLDKTISHVDQIPDNSPDNPPPSLPSLLGQMAGVMMSTLGISFFTLMIYGGFSWMIARGNEAEVEKAKKIITNGFWGLVVVFIAYAITWFRVGGDQTMRGIFWWDDSSYGE